jgi:hypothetical protein
MILTLVEWRTETRLSIWLSKTVQVQMQILAAMYGTYSA